MQRPLQSSAPPAWKLPLRRPRIEDDGHRIRARLFYRGSSRGPAISDQRHFDIFFPHYTTSILSLNLGFYTLAFSHPVWIIKYPSEG